MLNKLRIGPKLLLAPGLVLVLLLLLAGAAWYGMVRQNASLENMVQVRAARLKSVADVAGDAKYVHANAYQLLAWVNGSFAKARLDALIADIGSRHAALKAQLDALAQVGSAAERKPIDASLAALPVSLPSAISRTTLEIAPISRSMTRRRRIVTASDTAIDSTTSTIMLVSRLWNSSRAAA
jgi:hypothetical protein